MKAIAVNHKARHSTARLSERLAGQLLSVIYYPHPLSHGGLVLVFHDEVESLVDLITEAYTCVPLDLALHCLRRAELFELSLPTFTWLHVLNRRIHLGYCVKQTGVVLYGPDVRDEIPPPPEPRVLLNAHLESCAHFMRNHAILGLLASENYLELMKRIEWQMKCLMLTALLLRGEWAANIDAIVPRFERAYQDEQIKSLWQELNALIDSINWTDQATCRRAAYEAVWLFECFLRRLREYA
ncbi:MAG: hypothetical protein WBP93_16860 [Pyrinomonadaceae bacterium]